MLRSTHRWLARLACVLIPLAAVGCSTSTAPAPTANSAPPPGAPVPPGAGQGAASQGAASQANTDPNAAMANLAAAIGGAPVPVSEGATPAEPPPTERIKAEVGVGIKGRSLDQHEGIIVTPAKTLFKAKERIAFDIAVPHALALYKAENGQGPKSHEEFMEKIVTFNGIQLPKLPDGHRYVYDPESEQLMVERPKK